MFKECAFYVHLTMNQNIQFSVFVGGFLGLSIGDDCSLVFVGKWVDIKFSICKRFYNE